MATENLGYYFSCEVKQHVGAFDCEKRSYLEAVLSTDIALKKVSRKTRTG